MQNKEECLCMPPQRAELVKMFKDREEFITAVQTGLLAKSINKNERSTTYLYDNKLMITIFDPVVEYIKKDGNLVAVINQKYINHNK